VRCAVVFAQVSLGFDDAAGNSVERENFSEKAARYLRGWVKVERSG
jgi:hypothetical protein